MNDRDKFFIRILVLFGVLSLSFGLVITTLMIIGEPSEQVILRMVSAMGSMFAGMLGLAVGYISGRNGH